MTFDPSKESMHILSRMNPHGRDFRILGVSYDCRLVMDSAVRDLAAKARWKILMLLRSKHAFDAISLVVQYKQQVLSFTEYRTSAIYHATTTVLVLLDKLQDYFLKELGITREVALIDHCLAPLAMRRDIALLGLLHRAAIGEGPPQFREHFKRQQGSLQLVDILANAQPTLLMKRSIWGLVGVYNTLGGSLQCATVKDFQKHLQDRTRRVVEKQLWPGWCSFYSPRKAAAYPGPSRADSHGCAGGQRSHSVDLAPPLPRRSVSETPPQPQPQRDDGHRSRSVTITPLN